MGKKADAIAWASREAAKADAIAWASREAAARALAREARTQDKLDITGRALQLMLEMGAFERHSKHHEPISHGDDAASVVAPWC